MPALMKTKGVINFEKTDAIASPAVKTFKSWGLCDKSPWQYEKYNAKPLMFDENFMPKPEYTKLLEMLKTIKKETK